MRVVCAATSALVNNLRGVINRVVIQGLTLGITYTLYGTACRAIRSFNNILFAFPGVRHRGASRAGHIKIFPKTRTLVKNILSEVHERSLKASSIPITSIVRGDSDSGPGGRVGWLKRVGALLRTHVNKKLAMTSRTNSSWRFTQEAKLSVKLTPNPGKFATAFPEPGSASGSTSTTHDGMPLTFVKECEAGYILRGITVFAMQDEAERLLGGMSMRIKIITKDGICIVEFLERGASPRRNSTIRNLSLSSKIL
jgi:hypothetical protein